MSAPSTQVLLVEDNPGDARLVIEMLKENGAADFALTHVDTVRAALEHLAAHPEGPEAILLDLSLPDESGLETVRRVLSAKHRAGVVVMTGLGDEEVGVSAMQVGAQDYLVKGQVDARSLRRALRFAIQRQGNRTQLETLSLTDELTGLHNRRGFLLLAEQQIKLAQRSLAPIVLLFVDLDHFKQINDTFGHAEGDRALIETAEVLKRSLRDSDIKARLGGDEFAGLAVNASEPGEEIVRTRIGAALHDINLQRSLPYELTFSVGVLCCLAEPGLSMEDLLARADALMYEEKKKRKAVRV
jgi:diguanylate cyclase (GGDEF)-like protein